MMTMTQFLNRYIQGEPGEFYFQIDFTRGQISGGYFFNKHDARKALLGRLIHLLDNSGTFLPAESRRACRPKPHQAGPPT
jgi:hypothetical protein